MIILHYFTGFTFNRFLTISFTAVYISLDTVAIEADGHVTFHSMPDDKELDALYLAPELQEVGIITDKV